MTFTRFMGMCSGGSTKTDYEYIYIEADEDAAAQVMEKVFDENPYDVACECCGRNFSISEYRSLEEACRYDRKEQSVKEWISRKNVKVIFVDEIPE